MPLLIQNPPEGFDTLLDAVRGSVFPIDVAKQRQLADTYQRDGLTAALDLVEGSPAAPGLVALLDLATSDANTCATDPDQQVKLRRAYASSPREAARTLAEEMIRERGYTETIDDAGRETIHSMVLAAVEYEGEAEPELDLATRGRVRKIDRHMAEAREKLGPRSSEAPWKDTTRLPASEIQPWNDEHWERDRRRAEAAAEAAAAYDPTERPVDFEITREQWAGYAEQGADLVSVLVERRLARELEELERMREILTGVRRQVEVISDGPVHALAPPPTTMERQS